MKKAVAVLLVLNVLALPFDSHAQQPPPVNTATAPAPLLTPDQLAKLVGPIALYPDPMISLILPASTVPTDIVMAARFLRDKGDLNQIDSENWDPSVKGLARYPDVINMMNENLDWTNQLGAAVIAQQADVMTAIQAERAKAQSLGNLETTTQQKVVTEQNVIQIVPADPQVIYVPTYDPDVVYVQSAPPLAPLITFGAGLALGAWIGGGCDWYNHGIYTNGCWGAGGWNNNYVNVNINNYHNYNNWRPNPNRPPPRPPYNPNRPGGGGGGQQFPGFKPKPPGGWNGNRPGGNGSNKPGGGNGGWNGGNKPGGGGSGTWNGGNKPGGGGAGNGGNKPGGGGSGTWNGGNKPGGGGAGNGGNKPGGGGSGTPNYRPGGGSNTPKPAPSSGSNSGSKRSPANRGRENQDLPAFNRGGGSFQPNRSKPAAPQQSRPAFNRGGGGGGGGHLGGGGGGGGGRLLNR